MAATRPTWRGVGVLWHRRLTEKEWARIRRVRRYGPMVTLVEFWRIVDEDLVGVLPDGEKIETSAVYLDSDQYLQLRDLVGKRKLPWRATQAMEKWFVWSPQFR